MSYEVIKRRGARAYRYTVEYYHDDAGKGRTKWQYQGPVDASTHAQAPQHEGERKAAVTTGRLLDGLERLLAVCEYGELTANAIAREAGVAHGTFYRHFQDKRDALRATMLRLVDRAEHLAHLDPPGADREVERARMRDWLNQKLTTVGEHPGVWRAWLMLSESDPLIAKARSNVRAAHREMLTQYLEALMNLGLAKLDDPNMLASIILTVHLWSSARSLHPRKWRAVRVGGSDGDRHDRSGDFWNLGPVLLAFAFEQHCVAERKEPIPVVDRLFVGGEDAFTTGEGADQGEQR